MRFIDRVRIQVRAGNGGDGAVAWRRESHIPKGGPAGGDGGDGADIWFVADDQVSTLLDLKFRQHLAAEPGRPGAGASKNGRGGEDMEIKVPVGTSIYYEGEAGEPGDAPPWQGEEDGIVWEPGDESDPDDTREPEEEGMENVWVVDGGGQLELPSAPLSQTQAELLEAGAPPELIAELPHGETITGGAQRRNMSRFRDKRHRREQRPRFERGDLIGDLDQPGQRLLVARGGMGGRGNVHFRSSTNRAPDRAEPGTDGEAMWLRLELKLLADVGIVGFPNVGKSTLISSISRARPKIGAYPFTTLVPQLGVVSLPGDRSMVVADVPGLVDGASEGRGLGHEFLRHLERTRVLLHLLAPDPTPGREPLADLEALEGELGRYGSMFDGRPRVVALNKIDTAEGEALIKRTRRALRQRNIPLFPICAATGEGTDALLEALWRRLELVRGLEARAAEAEGQPLDEGPDA
ncbi:MAG: GTPase Obg [Myxococcales bacterium]|nr:GTPase Obg [Myxococcales bacterium]